MPYKIFEKYKILNTKDLSARDLFDQAPDYAFGKAETEVVDHTSTPDNPVENTSSDFNFAIFIDKALKDRVILRYTDLTQLKDGWHGSNSYALESESKENTRSLIDALPGQALSQWSLFANKNGTLVFKRKHIPIVNFTVSNTQFGYVTVDETHRMHSDIFDFDLHQAVSLFLSLTQS